jgi:cyanophycin synthetase
LTSPNSPFVISAAIISYKVHGMELLKSLALQSPNAWGRAPILEVWVADTPEQHFSPAQLAAVAQRLVGLAQPYLSASDFAAADRANPLPDGWPLAGWLERLARKLQSLCGVELPVGRVIAVPAARLCRIGIYFEDEGLVRMALDVANGLLTAAICESDYDFAVKLRELQSLANELCFGPSTRAIVEAARGRGIPVRRLNRESLVQFGLGAQQRRICTAETDGTGAIAESIAQDKELTKSLLERVGVPVPKGRTASSPEEAWEMACEIGLPVVVKPVDGNHGRGVTIKLSDRDRIMVAYQTAADEGSGVLVEQFVEGRQTRLLVVGNRLVAASRAEPEQVTGDGVHTVNELVDEVNLDPRRGEEYALPMSKMKLNSTALVELAEQGYDPSSIPPAGAVVMIHRHGEYTTDVTDQVHPEVAARAILATRVVGLDVAGIDTVLQDVSRPMEEQGGMVIEVNAGPGLQMHSEPQIGHARPVGAAIVETLFPDGKNGRIPIVAVTSGTGAAISAQVAAHLLRQPGLTVGLASSAGTFVGERRLAPRSSQPPGAAELFLNPLIEAGVFEISASAVGSAGLAFDTCEVAIVAPAGHLPEQRPDDVFEPDTWRRIVVESVSPAGTLVLAADDSDAERLAKFCRGAVFYYGLTATHPRLKQHKAAGGKIVFVRDAAIWAAEGSSETKLAGWKDASQPHALAALAGIAAAWAAGVPIENLQSGLDSLGPISDEASSTSASQRDDGASRSEQPRVA